MTSSKSINYSKYSSINEQNNLNLDERNIKKEEKSLNEFSKILLPISQDINNNNSLDTKGLLPINNEQNRQISVHNLLYGNPIDLINPKYIGKSFAFLYDFDGNPKMTIGPDCK